MFFEKKRNFPMFGYIPKNTLEKFVGVQLYKCYEKHIFTTLTNSLLPSTYIIKKKKNFRLKKKS